MIGEGWSVRPLLSVWPKSGRARTNISRAALLSSRFSEVACDIPTSEWQITVRVERPVGSPPRSRSAWEKRVKLHTPAAECVCWSSRSGRAQRSHELKSCMRGTCAALFLRAYSLVTIHSRPAQSGLMSACITRSLLWVLPLPSAAGTRSRWRVRRCRSKRRHAAGNSPRAPCPWRRAC